MYHIHASNELYNVKGQTEWLERKIDYIGLVWFDSVSKWSEYVSNVYISGFHKKKLIEFAMDAMHLQP